MSLAEIRKGRSIRRKRYGNTLPGVYLMWVETRQREMYFPEKMQFEMMLNDIGANVRVRRKEQGKFREEFGGGVCAVMAYHRQAIEFRYVSGHFRKYSN